MLIVRFLTVLTLLLFQNLSKCQQETMDFLDFIRQGTASQEEIQVFLNEASWAQFDPEVGYTLSNYFPFDGWNKSRTISTVNQIGARTSQVYRSGECRINTYGNSFTQCHQVSDAETWQEYLAGHLGEPIRNFGMGGFGVYQSYRRLIREEAGANGAENVILYIWGDDHLRSLLRCRYVLIQEWNKNTNASEGPGKMFHGNFWSNIEMNFETGLLEEHESRISKREDLFLMSDHEWMVDQLEDDFALQLYAYKQKKIKNVDLQRAERLASALGVSFDPNTANVYEEVSNLLYAYGFAATKLILTKAQQFTLERGKKLMVILFDPYGAMKQLLAGESRIDQEIVDFLEEQDITYFDMNVIHKIDYEDFNLDIDNYYKRYFIGHYNPQGNHFFAYSLAPEIASWLDPVPVPYRIHKEKLIDFNNYLDGSH